MCVSTFLPSEAAAFSRPLHPFKDSSSKIRFLDFGGGQEGAKSAGLTGALPSSPRPLPSERGKGSLAAGRQFLAGFFLCSADVAAAERDQAEGGEGNGDHKQHDKRAIQTFADQEFGHMREGGDAIDGLAD